MLLDLLLALRGIPGGIFVLSEGQQFRVSDRITVLHPSEREALNRVLYFGSSYYQLRKFIRENECLSSSHSTGAESGAAFLGIFPKGLYMRALCTGLRVVLEPYTDALLKLEEEFLADPYLGVCHIHASLGEFEMLLPALVHLVEEILENHCHGCEILGVIHRHSASGVPQILSAMKKILHISHGVLFKQLSPWLLGGTLWDTYAEFFIHCCVDAKRSDEDERLESERRPMIADLGEFANLKKTVADCGFEKRATFSLRGPLIPSYIPSSLAEMILFIGESVNNFGGNGILESLCNKGSSVFRGKENEFSKKLFDVLNEEEFSLSEFEAVIEEIRLCVSEHLWMLVVKNSDLYSHLKALKDIYLLGRGELFMAFIDQGVHFLNAVPNASTAYDLSNSFQVAARSLVIDDDIYLDAFCMLVDYKQKQAQQTEIEPFGTASSAACGWNSIRMSYRPPKPLHILLTPAVLEKYNDIFKFLLNVKRVQLELQKCWSMQMEAVHLKCSTGNHQWWHLRACMAFIVDNLQYYLQVDVLETQFHLLMERIKSTKDFEQIQQAHHNFLTNVSAETITNKPVHRCLQEMLDLCLSYCAVCKHSTRTRDDEVQTFTKNFDKCLSALLFFLAGSQLFLRLNFNGYLETHYVLVKMKDSLS